MHGGSAPPLVVPADATLTLDVQPGYGGFEVEIDGRRSTPAADRFRITLNADGPTLVTFGAAGMITTREFINVAAWHLFQDEALRARYLEADEPERFAVLHELLRLEPVVGNLKRRTTAPVARPRRYARARQVDIGRQAPGGPCQMTRIRSQRRAATSPWSCTRAPER